MKLNNTTKIISESEELISEIRMIVAKEDGIVIDFRDEFGMESPRNYQHSKSWTHLLIMRQKDQTF